MAWCGTSQEGQGKTGLWKKWISSGSQDHHYLFTQLLFSLMLYLDPFTSFWQQPPPIQTHKTDWHSLALWKLPPFKSLGDSNDTCLEVLGLL